MESVLAEQMLQLSVVLFIKFIYSGLVSQDG